MTNLNDAGAGSLRVAIASADGSADASSTITFASPLSGSITLTAPLPGLAKNITITGYGTVTVNGAGAFQPFSISGGKTCEFDNLTISQGDAGGGFGGAITNAGALTLSGCLVSLNHAGSGGGIYNASGATLTLVDGTQVISNKADGKGGGIYNNGGQVNIQAGCKINSDTATLGGGIENEFAGTVAIGDNVQVNGNTALLGLGGGIYNSDSGTLTMGYSTLSGNSATGVGFAQGIGGGLYNVAGATATLTGTTVQNNSAAVKGGGFYSNGSLTLDTCTVTGNTAPVGPGGVWKSGSNFTVKGGTVTGVVSEP